MEVQSKYNMNSKVLTTKNEYFTNLISLICCLVREMHTFECFSEYSRMLFGERPFWWIGESHLFDNKQPKVVQFPPTCETGPGE